MARLRVAVLARCPSHAEWGGCRADASGETMAPDANATRRPPEQRPAAEPPELPSHPVAEAKAKLSRLRRAYFAVANWFYANVIVGVFGLWLAGQVFRDRFHATGVCMFIPSILVFLALLGTALVAWLCACRRAALAAALLSVAPLGVVLAVENHWTRPGGASLDAEPLRIVHWNVWGGRRGWKNIAQRMLAEKPDIIAVSELYGEAPRQLLEHLGPAFRLAQARDMAVFARGTVVRPNPTKRVPGRAYLFHCAVGGAVVTVVVADLPSGPLVNRSGHLRRVRDYIRHTQPDVVLGDFNTPRRSLVLSRLPKGYAHAYHLAGKGWSYTWPSQFPFWAIDQCIVGPRLQAVRYSLRSSALSDHCMQVLDFAVRPAP